MISDNIHENIDNVQSVNSVGQNEEPDTIENIQGTNSVGLNKEPEFIDEDPHSDNAKSPQKSIIKSESEKFIENKFIPKGQMKSGRFWKSERKKFSSVINVKPLKKPLSKKEILRKERRELLAMTSAIKEEKQKRKEDLRERQKFNKERKLKNERKSEVVQVISNTKKLKKMSRKQLKYIETRDTTKK